MGRKFDRTIAEQTRGCPPLALRAEPSPEELEPLERARRERELSPDGIRAVLRGAGVGERIAELIAGHGAEEARIPRALREFASCFPHQGGGSALLAGPPGVGKSTSAAWLLARLHAAAISTGGENTGQLIRRLRVADLITAIFAKRTEVLRGAMDARMLVLDDLGASYEHEWPLGELDGLVDARYERQRGTIVTTNLWPHRKDGGAQAFEARYPRLWSRLLDSSGPGLVTMGGGDLRRRGGPKR